MARNADLDRFAAQLKPLSLLIGDVINVIERHFKRRGTRFKLLVCFGLVDSVSKPPEIID